MRVRMKDIAKIANVSEAAVSLVLNDKPSRISEKKKKEIKKIAEELNYTPNIIAQSLAKKTTQTIGIVVPDIENPFFSKLCKQFEENYRDLGYLTILVNTNDDSNVEKKLIEMLVNRGVDGLVIILSNDSFLNKQNQESLMSQIDIPFVLVDRQVEFENVNQVYFNSFEGGFIATEYLLAMGHRHIAFLSGDEYLVGTKERIRGYKKALETYSIKVNEEYIITTGYRFINGIEKSDVLFSLPLVTGAVVSNDMVAFGIIKSAKEKNVEIPSKLSLIGYDNLEISKILEFSLASICQETTLIVKETVTLMEGLISKRLNSNTSIVLSPRLVPGSSVKKVID